MIGWNWVRVIRVEASLSHPLTSLLLVVVGISGTPVAAQDVSYPTRTIRLVVPFGPGGPTDVAARVVTQVLGEALGQTVVVENKPGAGGALGTRFVAQAEPDGYTLLLGTVATLGAVPAVQKNPGFDPVKSFQAVGRLTESTTVLAVPANAPFKTVSELVAYAKANPDKLSYASAGIGNQTQLNAELFKAKTGTKIVHIPYKSGAEMVTSLLTGQAQLEFVDMSIILSQVEAGQIRVLAVTSPTRRSAWPDLPTMIESGVPDFTASFWTGVLAPAGTPKPIVVKLNSALNKGLESPEVKELLARIKTDPRPQTPEEFASFVAAEATKWRQAVETAGIQPE